MTDTRVDEANATESTASTTPQASNTTTIMTVVTTTTEATSSTTENEANVTGVEDVDEDLTTTQEVTDAATTNEANGTDGNEDTETTVAPTRKRRGRLGRGLRKDRKQRRTRSYDILDYENEFHLDIVTPHSTTSQSPITTYHPPHVDEHIASTLSAVQPAEKRRINTHKELFENVNSDTIEHIFYLNEHETVRVPYKIYDTVMKYGYINSLQASFLEIDLDSEYYNLIIIVPDYQDGLSTLTSKLRAHPASTLRYIRNSMDFYWIKTIVPKFHVKGNTILTSDLQNVRK